MIFQLIGHLFFGLLTVLWGARIDTDTKKQIVSKISASHRQQEINSRGVSLSNGCCKTVIISCDSSLPNCEQSDVSACRDLGVGGLYSETWRSCDFKHDIFRQNSPAMEISIGTVFDHDPGYWMVQPESVLCNQVHWVLRSRERNDLCPTDVKEWEVAEMKTATTNVNTNTRSNINTNNSINTRTTPISTSSTHSHEANPACISVKCHYTPTPSTTSTTTTTSPGDEGSSPFWKFLLACLAGAGSLVVGLFLWENCHARNKTRQEAGTGGREGQPLHLRQSDRGGLPFSDRPSLYPSNVASGSNSSDSTDEAGSSSLVPQRGTNQESLPSYEKALHM